MSWNAGALPPREAMSQLVTSWWISQAVRTMVLLDLPDHLAGDPRTAAEVAEQTGTHAPTMQRFLRTLAGLGLCATTDDGRFRLTPQGELLRSDAPHSMRSYVLTMTAPYVTQAWEQLPEALRNGEAAFPRVHGLSFWDYLAANPEEGVRFDGAMSGAVVVRAQALLAAVQLDGVKTLVDVGGGQGEMLVTVLEATPGLQGILFDQPQVLQGAEDRFAAAGVADRCQSVAGNFFVKVPRGADSYTLAMIVHDWPDDAAIEILRVCHQAMSPGARLWIVEQIVPPGDEFHRSKLLDLHMLVLFGARERTAEEHRALLEAAGFEHITIYPTDSPYSVIEAVRS